MSLLVWSPRVGTYFFYPVFMKMDKKMPQVLEAPRAAGGRAGSIKQQTYLRLSLQIKTEDSRLYV